MRDVKYLTPGEVRLRLSDRLRFLFYGRAYKRRFAARAAQHGIVFSPRFSRQPSYGMAFAAAGVAMLGVMLWLAGQLHEARIRNQAMAADLHAMRQQNARPRNERPPNERSQPSAPLPEIARPAPPEVRVARADLGQARASVDQAQSEARELAGQLKRAQEALDSLRADMAGTRLAETQLTDRLRESELRVSGLSSEVKRLETGRSEDTEVIASQKFRLREITGQLNQESDTIAQERKLLVADMDIRELMGARSLHIVDVFDVDGKGKTQRPFGRVFYTEGKSLVFYAFDLKGGGKGGGTFQAWGQRESKEESARSLGIFYVDDQKQNRWVLKFADPKVLAEINAVFVTVEPPGGSTTPNRQKMLYAYLNATANHP